MVASLVQGLILGFSGGIGPGPLQTLLLTETLRGGWWAGVRVALAPLFTDGLLVLLALVLTRPLGPQALAVLGAAGGCVLLVLGARTVQGALQMPAVAEAAATDSAPGAFGRGLLTNLMNPNPYVFWFTVGGPLLRQSPGLSAGAGFLGAFFVAICGTKAVLAVTVSWGRRWLRGAAYRWSLGGSGLLLALLGGYNLWQAAHALVAG